MIRTLSTCPFLTSRWILVGGTIHLVHSVFNEHGFRCLTRFGTGMYNLFIVVGVFFRLCGLWLIMLMRTVVNFRNRREDWRMLCGEVGRAVALPLSWPGFESPPCWGKIFFWDFYIILRQSLILIVVRESWLSFVIYNLKWKLGCAFPDRREKIRDLENPETIKRI